MNTREALLKAAHELFLQKGNDFTMQDLADRVGIAKGTVYRFFASKTDIFQELVLKVLDRLDRLLKKLNKNKSNSLERLLGMGHVYIRLYQENPREFALISELDFLTPGLGWAEETPSKLGERSRNLKNQLLQYIREGQEQGLIRRDLDPTLTSLVMSQIVKSFMQSIARAEQNAKLVPLCGFSAEQLIQELFDLLRRALSSEDIRS